MKPDLIVGDSGDGKTTLLGTAALRIYKATKKVSRLWTADPGGWGPLDALVRLKIVKVCDLNLIQGPIFENLWLGVHGYWPDQTGKLVKTDLSDSGGFFFEGLTSFSEACLGSLADKVAGPDVVGQTFGPDPAVKFADGARWIGSNGLSHYGIVQNEMLKLVNRSAKFNGQVIWTAREKRGFDEGTKAGSQIYGPELAGGAKTGSAPAWFGHCLGLETRPYEGPDPKLRGTLTRVLHTQKWFDKTNPRVPHLAKTRATPLELFVRDFQVKDFKVPAECLIPAELDPSLEAFYDMYERTVEKSVEVLETLLKQQETKK